MTEYKDRLAESLKAYFNVYYDKAICNFKFDVYGEFNQRTAKYMLTKEAEIYAFKNDEYIFYKELEEQPSLEFIKYIHKFLDENLEDILNVDNEHMSSIITFIISSNNNPDYDTIKAIQRFKYHKSFALGFKGWVNVRLIFVNPETQDIFISKFRRREGKKFLFKNN